MEADFIIIGGGPSGSSLAQQLSESRKFSVILVEAGPNRDDDPVVANTTLQNIHTQIGSVTAGYVYDWNTAEEPGLDGRKLLYLNACELGGNSSLNGAQYSRSTVDFHEEFSRITGSEIWNAKNSIEGYKFNENYTGTTSYEEARGRKGVVGIRQAPITETPVSAQIAQTFSKVTGAPLVEDCNVDTMEHRQPVGIFTRWQLFEANDGSRNSGSRMFIKPNVVADGNTLKGTDGRKLIVLLLTKVTKIDISQGVARGVYVKHNGSRIYLKANNEVICCAGVQTAPLLQLSGIGDAKKLKELDIPNVVDNLNVGQNHKDSAMILIKVLGPKGSVPENDPQAMFCGGCFFPDVIESKYKRGYMLNILPAVPASPMHDVFILNMLQLHSHATGSITIQSKDPTVLPLVVENILNNPVDLETFKVAIQKYIVAPMDALVAENPGKYMYLIPSRDILTDMSPGGLLEKYLKSEILNAYHYCGTCRAGTNVNNGVVDYCGNVFGVERLRVVDASIIPIQPDSTMTSVILLVSRTIGRIILEKY